MIVTLKVSEVGPLQFVDPDFKIKAEYRTEDGWYVIRPGQLVLAGARRPGSHQVFDGFVHVNPNFVKEH